MGSAFELEGWCLGFLCGSGEELFSDEITHFLVFAISICKRAQIQVFHATYMYVA